MNPYPSIHRGLSPYRSSFKGSSTFQQKNPFARVAGLIAVLNILCGAVIPCRAQEARAEKPTANAASDLQKQTQNPVSSLISVPIQNNSNFGIGPYSRIQNVLNIQPVIPVKAGNNLNLIIRWIAPILYQPAPGTADLEIFGIDETTPIYLAAVAVQAHAGVAGFGDMAPTIFFTPAKPHKLILGVGPEFVLPTATSKVLGQGKLSIGPSVVALVQPGHFSIGALANNVWSIAGPSDRNDVNQMNLQYFLNYNLPKGWYFSSSPTLTANWQASSGKVWTVPFGGGFGRIMRLGFQPVNLSAQFYGNAKYPTDGSPWTMRLSIAFLFPQMPKKSPPATGR